MIPAPKLIRVIDSMTEISACAFRLSDVEGDPAIAARAGFGATREQQRHFVFLVRLDGAAAYDPFAWGDATMTAAHVWLVDHFDDLPPGGTLDAEPLRLALIGERA